MVNYNFCIACIDKRFDYMITSYLNTQNDMFC